MSIEPCRGAVAVLVVAVALAAAPAEAQRAGGAPQLLLLAPEVDASRDTALARLAQRFTARVLQSLTAAEVPAARAERGLLDSLREAGAAPFVLDASLSGDPGRYSAQLRLVELASGNEVRAYLFGPGDAEGVLGLADRAAPRVAATIAGSGSR